MAEAGHTLAPTCAFYDGLAELTSTPNGRGTPQVQAQFFYVSALPIDDPLSPLPPIQNDKTTNVQPQPFSNRDNAALEEAWLGIQRSASMDDDRSRPTSKSLNRMFSFPKFEPGLKSPDLTASTAASSSRTAATIPHEGSLDQTKLKSPGDTGRRISQQPLQESQVMVGPALDHQSTAKPVEATERRSAEFSSSQSRPRTASSLSRARRQDRGAPSIPQHEEPQVLQDDIVSPAVQTGVTEESNISGRPFARAPSSRQIKPVAVKSDLESDPDPSDRVTPKFSQTNGSPPDHVDEEEQVFVPVGVSRLHLVELPSLEMKPIYWSPINDISSVIRATWFYKDTMLPLPVDIANRLEIGYEDMRPYTEAYQDELTACIENGAAAELKIVYTLWPDADEVKSSRSSTSLGDKTTVQELVDEPLPVTMTTPRTLTNAAIDPRRPNNKRRMLDNHGVVFVNSREAQILRPSALPSVSRNRRPLSALRKGRQLGVAVVRGFDRKVWQKLHPDSRFDMRSVQAKAGAQMSQSGSAATASRSRTSCPKCEADEQKSKVSDLVLVIHGIGQKLSERVDSYHFTHAINGLRREFNVEQAVESVRGSLEKDTGIMVLPINWRLTVNFDEDGSATESSPGSKYELKDVTPDSLPAVRSLISDVMLDIPYYLSHHKTKMTAAVIREANRVYRLWCRNNPGFQTYGRVHVIAHSLGSVMAMEILSHQPTRIPDDVDLGNSVLNETMFEFDTTNLFCCGSPSGFFLLLNNANLVPRRGRDKPGMQGEDVGHGIAGEVGQYGCLAVDNVYNICHRNDPIAYQQNACVDKGYALSLQSATIPSATQSLFSRINNSLRWAPSTAHDAYGAAVARSRPNMQHLPSTVELETHNFSREEVAEKRMFLLNDNGQIDYFLNSGGGPLEIQYLNMLSAHSSYWVLQDFVRFLVVEIGRKPGRAHTLPVLRAVKKREYKKGNIA